MLCSTILICLKRASLFWIPPEIMWLLLIAVMSRFSFVTPFLFLYLEPWSLGFFQGKGITYKLWVVYQNSICLRVCYVFMIWTNISGSGIQTPLILPFKWPSLEQIKSGLITLVLLLQELWALANDSQLKENSFTQTLILHILFFYLSFLIFS